MTSMRRCSVLILLVLIALIEGPPVLSQNGETIGGYQLVSDVRITRTINELTYRAMLANTGAPLSGATATAASLSPATTIVDGTLTFGPVQSNATVVSTDTFSFRHDRTVPFNWANIRWTTASQAANQPPAVNAGPDLALTLPASASLTGSVTDDGLPAPPSLFVGWNQQSGPGSVSFADASAATTTASFTQAGTYVLRLSASDSVLSSFDEATITPKLLVDLTVQISRRICLTADDERCACFVDQNRVHFVDNRVVKGTLNVIGEPKLHIVA